VPDDMDLCQQINEELIEDSLAAHYRRGIRNAMADPVTACVDCTAQIPEKRRLVVPGCTRCIDCQTEYETLHGRGHQ